MRSIDEVFAEIATWTNFPDELSKRGITGTPDCSESCPMANFIVGETDPKEVSMLTVDAYVTSYWGPHGDLHEIDNPALMDRFIIGFDDGDFPDLADDPSYWDGRDEAEHDHPYA